MLNYIKYNTSYLPYPCFRQNFMLPLESIHDVGVPIPIGQSVAELFLMY